MFSTCTINRSENEENRDYLIEKLGMIPESIDEFLPKDLLGDTTQKGYIQLLPGVHQADGFFIARFKKPVRFS